MPFQPALLTLWTQSDGVTATVALLLLAMSMASWLVILLKAINLYQFKGLSRRTDAFWHCDDLDLGVSALGQLESNPFVQLVKSGREASRHCHQTQSQIQTLTHGRNALNLSDWINRALRFTMDDATSRLQSGLAVLASVGSTAPFVGLFGTVWGIYHALMVIGANSQPSLDKVAGPIGEALVMTAFGLAVAIPAVLGYNALIRGNKLALTQLNRFAYDLHAYFVSGARVGLYSQNRLTGNLIAAKKA
jgi:biopolymer transport protein ExbB